MMTLSLWDPRPFHPSSIPFGTSTMPSFWQASDRHCDCFGVGQSNISSAAILAAEQCSEGTTGILWPGPGSFHKVIELGPVPLIRVPEFRCLQPLLALRRSLQLTRTHKRHLETMESWTPFKTIGISRNDLAGALNRCSDSTCYEWDSLHQSSRPMHW
jgi:hypothetical protein